jgi:hypothetical protein
MGSSFNTYLNEGLIKLPPKLSQALNDYFTYWYLAFLEGTAEADKSYDEDDQDMIKLAIERLAKKHNSKIPTPADVKKSMTNRAIFKNFPVEDLPPQYLEKVAKVKGQEAIEELKKAHVKFVVAFRPHPKVTDDEEGIFYSKPAEIIISIPNMPVSADKVIHLLSLFNHAEASRSINNTLGIVEHELMHAVQSMVLFLLHRDQYSNKGSKSVNGLRTQHAKQDKYFTDDIEFSPWVKTSTRELKSIFGKQKATTDQEKKDLFAKFTYSDVLGKDVSKADNKKFERSPFFKSLKRSDPVKWKKAVKLLSQETL